jgi:hypothetical protein
MPLDVMLECSKWAQTIEPLPRKAIASIVKLRRKHQDLLDRFFYDVGALSVRERAFLESAQVDEGALLRVAPKTHGDGGVSQISAQEAVAEQIVAAAIPGVGSSVIGAAALARNVADHIGAQVVGIVAGYGTEGLLADALGGWITFRGNNWLRFCAHELLTLNPASEPLARTSEYHAKVTDGYVLGQHRDWPAMDLSGVGRAVARLADPLPHRRADLVAISESERLCELLDTAPPALRLLVGHSKGSLSIAFALHALRSERPQVVRKLGGRLKIVTLGAVAAMPSEFESVFQFLGAFDALGGVNSNPMVPYRVVPGCAHWLNSRLPLAMAVCDVLDRAGVAGASGSAA